MPKQLRQLFATILIYCQLTNILELWNTYLPALFEDFVYNPNSKHVALDHNDPKIVTQVLLDIEKYLFQNRKSLSDFSKLQFLIWLFCNNLNKEQQISYFLKKQVMNRVILIIIYQK